ncbi:MAG: small multi-drug export protein [Promethearchaeati archaeon SRVP18_Atabeyarchaeia-1]
MSVGLLSIIAVFALSASPIGEILIAIAFGVVVLGMDPALAFLAAYPGNLIPIIVILPLLGYLGKRFPRFFNYMTRRSGRFGKRLGGKYGWAFLFLIVLFAGAYGASTVSGLLGVDKKRSFLVQSVALAFYGAVEVIALYFGIGVISSLP